MKTRLLIQRIHRKQGISVVLSTHYMPEAEMLCDRIAFLRRGEIAALDTPQNLKNHLGLGERVVVRYAGPVDIAKLEAVPGVLSVLALPGRVEIVIDRSTENLDRIVKLFSNATILDISIKRARPGGRLP